MTRNKNTYRLKGRALLLAAIMIISMVAIPAAFAGAAAANVNQNAEHESHTTITSGTVYQGQQIAINITDANLEKDGLELRYTDGDRVDGLVSSPTVQGEDGDEYVVLDTDRNAEQYILSNLDNGEEFRGDGVDVDAVTFEIAEQDLDTSFGDDVTDEGDSAETTLEIESDIRNNYAVNISADGLDTDELETIFSFDDNIQEHHTNDFSNSYDLARTNADAGNYTVIDDDSDVLTLLNAEGDWDVSFDDIDTDEYNFTIEGVDTTASANDSITVSDNDAEINFVDSNVDVAQGDIAEIVMEAEDTNEGTLIIGDEDDINYQVNVTVEGFDEDDIDDITVYFNTYAAGNETLGDAVVLDNDDASDGANIDVEYQSHTDWERLLSTGDYEMTVSTEVGVDRFEETQETPDDVGSLFIEERFTESISLGTTSSESVDDITSENPGAERVEFIQDAIDNERITEADDIAHEDYAVHRIEASGLKGLFAWADHANDRNDIGDDELELAEGLVDLTENIESGEGDDTALELRVRETAASTGPNTDSDSLDLTSLDLSEDDVVVVHDADTDEYFIMLNTEAVANELGLDNDDEHELEIRFTVQDDRLLEAVNDDDDDLSDLYEQFDLEHDLLERDGSFDVSSDDLVEVETGDEEVTGETNIAPGSEVEVRLRGTDETRFSMTQSDVVVEADGSFTGEFDFSDRDVDDTFNAELRNVITDDDNPNADGVVVENVGTEPVDDGEPVDDDSVNDDDSVDDENATDDDATVDDEETVDDATEDDTPGFGAIVALVALIGAALLAIRRQN